VKLFAVIEPPPPSVSRDLNPQLHEHETVTHRTRDAEEYLSSVAEGLQAEGLSVSFDTPTGTPGPMIVEEADKDAGTLIAMGAHGRSGVSRWWLGSVADRVLHLTSKPFLVVRSHQQDDLVHQEGFSRIVVPVDGSSIAEQVLPHVVYLATGLDLVVDLVRVTPSRDEFHRHLPHLPGRPNPSYEDYSSHANAEAAKYLAQLKENLQRQGVNSVEEHLLQGDPAASIIDIAAATDDRLVAMTTHGRSGLGRWVLGSVAERVVRHSGDPVVLVRATEPPAG
jgi:nucleotide-binding universal stress UspA family protein